MSESMDHIRSDSSEEVARHMVWLGLGSNCGDRSRSMSMAIEWLGGILEDAEFSHVYETSPVGSGTRPYLNAVVSGWTVLDDESLNLTLKAYERMHGRDDAARCRGDVPVDIDLVVSGGKVLRPRDWGCAFFRIGYDRLCASVVQG